MKYFIDVQGTIIDDIDRLPIEGSLKFINGLKENSIPFLLITNNTKYKSRDFISYLQNLGFDFDRSQYLDPFTTLCDIVGNNSIMAIGNGGFIDSLQDIGCIFDEENPDYLVVSLKEDLTYDELATAVETIQKGAKLIGMHETAVYAKKGRKYPGLGAIIRALEYATNTKAIIVGKPSVDFYLEAKKLIGTKSFEEICIISDDAIGDLVGAKKLGMKTILVLSGKYKKSEEIIPFLSPEDRPDEVYKSIAEIQFKVDKC